MTLDPLELELTDGCEPPHGCWELNSGPLQEQQVLLTAGPSLQLPFLSLILCSEPVHRGNVSVCLFVFSSMSHISKLSDASLKEGVVDTTCRSVGVVLGLAYDMGQSRGTELV